MNVRWPVLDRTVVLESIYCLSSVEVVILLCMRTYYVFDGSGAVHDVGNGGDLSTVARSVLEGEWGSRTLLFLSPALSIVGGYLL